MELRQLEYFREICRHKSISEAAKSLYISQQGLSKSVAALERELGVSLMERGNGGLRLTEEGAYLRDRCEPIVGQAEEIRVYFRRRAALPRQKLWAVLTSGTNLLLPQPFWEGFAAAHPEIGLQLTERLAEDCERDLMLGNADIAFANLPVDREKFRALHLASSPVYAVIPRDNPLSGEPFLTLDRLEGAPLVMTADQYRAFLAIFAGDWAPRPVLEVRYRVPELLSAYAVCQRKLAVGFSFQGVLNLIPAGTAAVPLQDSRFRWRLGLITRRDAPLTPAASRLWEYAAHWRGRERDGFPPSEAE